MLLSGSALTGGCRGAQWWLAAAACSGTEKSSKAREAGPLTRCSFPHRPTRLSICHLSAANPEQLSPLPRLRQNNPFSPTCKHKSAWGTLCSPDNFTHCRMKLLHHPSPPITTWEASLGATGWHGTHYDLWMGDTYLGVQKAGETAHWKVELCTTIFFHPWISNGFCKQGFRFCFPSEVQE